MIIVTYNGNTYDLTSWSSKHPGGARLIQSAHGCDITEIVQTYHKNWQGMPFLPMNVAVPTLVNKPYIFGEDYKKQREQIYNTELSSCDPYDLILWGSLMVYLLDWNCFLSALMLVIMGGFGHQYVHTSSFKASFLTFTGFISNHWRSEHVFSHHPFTNTHHDIDLENFITINTLPLPSAIRFLLVSMVIVFRPFIQYVTPKYFWQATWTDLLIMLYNVYDLLLGGFGLGWFIKRLLPAMWFLIIDYFNHYTGVEMTRVSDSFVTQQLATTQNFVFNQYLYDHYPFIHSLLTFGLDRQVEHHLFPRTKMEHLKKIKIDEPIKTHYFGFHSIKWIWHKFV